MISLLATKHVTTEKLEVNIKHRKPKREHLRQHAKWTNGNLFNRDILIFTPLAESVDCGYQSNMVAFSHPLCSYIFGLS